MPVMVTLPQNTLPRLEPRPPPRMGPRPLGLHLMTALYASLSLPTAWPNLKSDWPSLNPGAQTRLQKLRELGRNPAFEAALAQEAIARSRRFIAGIKFYQHHPLRRNIPPTPIVWQSGTTCLRDYNPQHPDAPIVLVIPSLINRFDILDLDQRSFFLCARWRNRVSSAGGGFGCAGRGRKRFFTDGLYYNSLMPMLDIRRRAE